MSVELKQLADDARKLANALFVNVGATGCVRAGDASCLQAEENRPLTKAELARDWVRRPFWAYERDHLCACCEAYWFAEQAAQSLHRMYCLVVKYGTRDEKAESARKEGEHATQDP